VGAAGGGAVGAAIGATGGPVGAGAGLVAGANVGGPVSKGAAEKIDPTPEDENWRQNYASQAYIDKSRPFEDYQPAYRLGYESYSRYSTAGKTYEEIEVELRDEYERLPRRSTLSWEQARPATRAAWERVAVRDFGPFIDEEVVDNNGNKIGTLHSVWTDQTGHIAFLGVKTGWLFGKNHVVPSNLAEIDRQNRRVRLPLDEDAIKEAPALDADCNISEEKQREIHDYYRNRIGSGAGRVPTSG